MCRLALVVAGLEGVTKALLLPVQDVRITVVTTRRLNVTGFMVMCDAADDYDGDASVPVVFMMLFSAIIIMDVVSMVVERKQEKEKFGGVVHDVCLSDDDCDGR
jgi:hypothetical protein